MLDFYGLKTPECIGIPGVFDGFKLLTYSAFGYPKALTAKRTQASICGLRFLLLK